MERLHPGVYVEEVPGGARPIEGVSTSTAAFLGKAERGPLDRALLVTSFIEFQTNYGGSTSAGSPGTPTPPA
jgi:phage tail sheath protein FI